jgi:hypothetical protein
MYYLSMQVFTYYLFTYLFSLLFTLLFVVYLTTLSVAQTIQRRIIG